MSASLMVSRSSTGDPTLSRLRAWESHSFSLAGFFLRYLLSLLQLLLLKEKDEKGNEEEDKEALNSNEEEDREALNNNEEENE